MIKVAIVDDHLLFLESFTLLLQTMDRIEVWGSFSSGERLLEALEKQRDATPDVIFLDLKMKGMNGFDCLPWLKKDFPDIRIIIISMFDQAPFIKRAGQLGAMGFITKESDSKQIHQSILSMHHQGFYLSETLSKRMVSALHEKQNNGLLISAEQLLTEAELEVLSLLAQGMTAIEIGEQLHRSPRTIEGHKQRLLEKTNQKNASGVVAWAFRQGLIM